MDKRDPSGQPRDKMDRLIQEAQQEGLFHGRLKRILLAGYEGRQQTLWMQRTATAVIVGVLIGLAATWMGLPVPVVLALFSACLLVAAICLGFGLVHLVRYLLRYYAIDAYPDEDDAANKDVHAEAKPSGHRDEPG